MVAGTNTLVMGPSGIGKTTVTVRCTLAALDRGDKAAFYLFDEGVARFLARNASLGMDLRPHLESRALTLRHVDPAELSPEEFAQMARDVVEAGVRFVVIDSLNAYLQAMPSEQYLILQMHGLLSYLNQKGVTTALVMGEHGLVGELRRDVDLSYLTDSTLLLRFFESSGKLRRALTVVKSRAAKHALTINESTMHSHGIEIGEPFEGFEGGLTGLPTYRGGTAMLPASDQGPD